MTKRQNINAKIQAGYLNITVDRKSLPRTKVEDLGLMKRMDAHKELKSQGIIHVDDRNYCIDVARDWIEKFEKKETIKQKGERKTESERFNIEESGQAELTILENKNLFELITKEELDKKIVQEVETRQVIFLVGFGGSLVENAKPTSTNLLVNAESGAGKDYTTWHTLKVLPKDRIIKRTRISPTTFSYWHNAKFEPEWTWDGKTVYLEDVSGNVLNSEVFKVMSSGGSKATIVINQQAVDIEINGKPSLIITTATSTPKPELVRRFPIVQLDEGVEQTKAINVLQAEQAASGINSEYSSELKQALACLKRVKVKVPFAKELVGMLPDSHIIMRTHFDRFLDYIKFSTAIHQFQRETDEAGFIIAEEKDFQIARKVLLKTTSNALMIPLTRDQQHLIEIVAGLGSGFHAVSDIESKVTNMSDKWLRVQLDLLTRHGFLEKDKREQEGRKDIMVYKAKSFNEFSIPETLEECRNSSITSGGSSSTIDSITSSIPEQLELIERGAGAKEISSLSEPSVPKVDRKVIK